MESIHSFIGVRRTRFVNRIHGLKPRPCRDNTEDISFPREAAEKTGAQRQRQGRVPLLLS